MAIDGTLGRDKGSVLAYALWWVTGIVVLFMGRADPDLRYHGAQSLVLFGELSVAYLVLSFLGNILRGSWLALIPLIIGWGVLLFWFLAWLYCLFQAWQGRGRRFEVPLVSDYVTRYAEQLADATG